ncbi:MAG: glycine zipper domain-containing protein [Phycisphaerales bacterium]
MSIITSVRGVWQGLRRGTAPVGLAAAVAMTAGCNNAGEGALTGAGLGAATGAIIGSFTGSAGAGALIGAAAGAVGGGVIGDQNQRNARGREY